MAVYAIEKDREFGYFRTTPKPDAPAAMRRKMSAGASASRAAILDTLAKIAGPLSGRRLFDIGCGSGEFLDLCRDRGIDCAGWEDVPNWARSAAAKGHRVVTGDLAEIPQAAPRKYDIVSLFGILQHLAEPARALSQIRTALLAHRGTLVVGVPNTVDPPEPLRLATRGEAASAPMAANYFGAESLTDLLEGCGFKIAETGPRAAELVMFAKPDAYSRTCRATVVKNWGK